MYKFFSAKTNRVIPYNYDYFQIISISIIAHYAYYTHHQKQFKRSTPLSCASFNFLVTILGMYQPSLNIWFYSFSLSFSKRKLYCISSLKFIASFSSPNSWRILKPISMAVPGPREVRIFPDFTNTSST